MYGGNLLERAAVVRRGSDPCNCITVGLLTTDEHNVRLVSMLVF